MYKASLRRETEEQLGTQKGVQDEIVAKVASVMLYQYYIILTYC